MTWYVLFVVLRLLVTAFFLLTSAYSVLNYTPFIFNQFLRVRMFGSINAFVASHHIWYCAAYLASVVTILPDLRRPDADDRLGLLRRRMALAYVVVFGLVGEWLVVTPYLPTLWNDRRSFVAALVSFTPVLWLAAIDHLARRPGTAGQWLFGPRTPASHGEGDVDITVTDQRRLLIAATATAAYVWLAHLVRAYMRLDGARGASAWVVDAVWSMTVSVTAMMVLFAVLNLIVSLAVSTRAPRAAEYILEVVLGAAAIALVLLSVVFPSIAFGDFEPVAVALTAGLSLAAAWSGLVLARPRARTDQPRGGLDVLVAPVVFHNTWVCVAVLGAVPFIAAAILHFVERLDWNFLLQETVVVAEWGLVWALMFALTRRLPAMKWSRMRAAAPPVAAACALTILPWASERIPGTGGARFEAEVELDRYGGADPSFKLFADALVQHPGRDAQFRRYLQSNTSVSTKIDLTAPVAPYAAHAAPAAARRPHIFLFVLDSLRRDYLSPFNRAVTFTPSIERFARESFAFQNAFSRYGGTSLAVPSIWAGGLIIHRTWLPDFARTNALEKLVDADRYRWFMSVDSVMAPLISRHADLVELDRGRQIMDFDMCRTLVDLEGQLTRAPSDGRPAFAFSLPQNLHVSNRQHASVPPGERYPGFFEPYAAEVHRIDGCFGEFFAFLKRERIYDDSIIVLTTDHGDSLGEEGRWGHGVTLFPEVVRIPLIVHIPEWMKADVTTDLARVSFSTDIVPTLYQLAGRSEPDRGPLYGSPLFVPRRADPSPRDREAFVLVSSYGPTYGLLRQNGRALYIVDLVNGREYAFDLTAQPLGVRVPVTDDIRRVSQPLIREQVHGLAELYHFHPAS